MGRSPRIVSSLFDPASLSARVARQWGWSRAKTEFWSRGVNDTYRVEGSRRRAYLRIYRHRWRTRAEIQGELDLLLFLNKRGAGVSVPLRKRDGSFIDEVAAPEGRRYAVLFSAAEGASPVMDARGCRDFGRLAGALHALCDAIPVRFRRFRMDLDHLVHRPLGHIAAFIDDRPRDVAFLKRVAADLSGAIASLLPAGAPGFGLCHGDLYAGNLLRDGAGRLTLLDFDCCGYGWRAYDLADFLWSRSWKFTRAAKAQRDRQWNTFLEGYGAVRRLSAAELQAVYAFVPLRHIWLMGLHIGLRADRGARWVGDSYIDGRLDFIRNWLKAYKPV